MPDDNSFCFVFVCQQGILERQAIVLVASLRRHFGGGPEIVAAIPGPADVWGAPCRATLDILCDHDVRMLPIVNPVSTTYPIGNKIACLSVETMRRHIVFLDTDIIALRSADMSPLAASQLSAVAASEQVADMSDWEVFYNECIAPFPAERMQTLVSDIETAPYFNSGLIAVDRAIAADLCAEWSGCANQLLLFDQLPKVV
ncbi:MAG: hypothetical protein JHC61_14335, partial [Burkholderiaceae bacterium]|nr:hypothetical protein [Burkholderiaceae bacterium]